MGKRRKKKQKPEQTHPVSGDEVLEREAAASPESERLAEQIDQTRMGEPETEYMPPPQPPPEQQTPHQRWGPGR